VAHSAGTRIAGSGDHHDGAHLTGMRPS
jgi:hypothetical protein